MSLAVLIVEDEAEFRKYLCQAVPWSDYDMELIGAVDDLEPARDAIASRTPDLVLLDITLQRGNGLDLVETLRAREPAPRIIVISGHSEFETVRAALRLGVDDYLLKPFAKQELLMSVLSNREHLLERIQQRKELATLQSMMIAGWLDRIVGSDSQTETERLEVLLEKHGVAIPTPPRVLLVSEVTDEPSGPGERLRRWLSHIAEMWRTVVEGTPGIAWIGMDDRVYCLFSGSEPSEVAWEILDIAEEFTEQAERRLPVSVTVGISSVDQGVARLAELQHQATTALESAGSDQAVVVYKEESSAHRATPSTGEDHRGTLLRWHELATRFIDEYHHDPTLDVQTVASHLGISTEYLRRIFRAGGGTTCIEAIKRRRLEHAKRLLREETTPIGTVAKRSGFSDAAYFAREFRRFIGVTPREYRDR